MSMYRNDGVLITDLMDRISNLENQMTELKRRYTINNLEKVIVHFYMDVRYVVRTVCIWKIR